MKAEELLDRDGLPSDQHVEQVVLGTILDGVPEVVEEAMATVREDFFSLDAHRRIFAAVSRLHKDGQVWDTVVAATALIAKAELEAIGGRSYLWSLTENLPRHRSISRYIDILEGFAERRYLLVAAERAQAMAADRTTPVEDTRKYVGELLERLADSKASTRMESVGEYLQAAHPTRDTVFDAPALTPRTPTGFWKFDQMMSGGLVAGELTVVAARPSMGKTAWVSSLCGNFVKGNVAAGIWPMEQGKPSMFNRIVCGMAKASFADLRAGKSSEPDKRYIREEMASLEAGNLYWSHETTPTVTMIRAQALRLQRELAGVGTRLQAIVLDQLSFIAWDDFFQRGMNPNEAIGHVTRRLKALAKELNLPVVLMAQLNRGTTDQKDQKPTLKSLADSGKIEQNADNVLFLHRAEYYDRTDDALKGKGEFILEKQRDGKVGSWQTTYSGDMVLWQDQNPRGVQYEF